MFTMIEAVGISEKGLSEACAQAVEELHKLGHDVHFFEIVQQRGSVKSGKIQEYQVIIKAGIKS